LKQNYIVTVFVTKNSMNIDDFAKPYVTESALKLHFLQTFCHRPTFTGKLYLYVPKSIVNDLAFPLNVDKKVIVRMEGKHPIIEQ